MTKLGKPIESMRPVYLPDVNAIMDKHNNHTKAELKYDGYRLQLHKQGDKIWAFTRNHNSIEMRIFPELSQSISALPDCILDCELNGGVGHAGYEKVSRRFRHKIGESKLEEYLSSGITKGMPMDLRVFDTLHWEGNDLMQLPLSERRKYTEAILEKKITPSHQWDVRSAEELQTLFEKVTAEHHEGLVCKDPSSIYIPGHEGGEWVKLKKFETLDLVVLGAYMKDEELTQILCGTLNPETNKYETLGKVNARREGLNAFIYQKIGNKLRDQKPRNVVISEKIGKQMPDYFVRASDSLVVEIRAMNILRSKNWQTCGLEDGKAYSMRIGWLKAIRYDKGIKQATTTQKVAELYRFQEEAK